jgi:DNA polymerase, archaea type
MEGKAVCAFYEGYKPYFYAEGERVPDLLKDEFQVEKIERVSRKMTMGYGGPKEIFKVTISNPSKTPELREKLVAAGITTFESDILFKYRFMNDLGLSGLGWIKLDEGNGVATETVNVEKCVRADGFKTVERIEDAPLRTMAFDIECVSESGGLPEAERDPIVMISMVFNENFRGSREMVLSTRPGPGVTAVSTEQDVLEKFSETIKEFDPDILTGYNINNFDLPYIIGRMHHYRMRPILGRCNHKQANAKKIMSKFKISIIGRMVVDSFEIIKKDYSLMRYSLDFVSKRLLNERKEDVRVHQIVKYWRGSTEEYAKLVKYGLKDSVLAMMLLEKLNLIDKYVALSKVSGTLMQDAMSSGETTRIENYLLREFNKAGFVLPCRPAPEEVERRNANKKTELKGGFVLEPVKELHSNVVVLDFKSMYPSIIRTFNICPTTLVTGDVKEKSIETADASRFVDPEVRKGIIPAILERLMTSRAAAKKKKTRAKDPFKKKAYDAEQWALKIMANAFYGYMGYSRARVYDLRIANAITSSGRNIIHTTKDIIEKEHGYDVIYGDTDSVMVKLDTDDMEKIRKIAVKISKEITDRLPGIMELEFEKVFKRFMPLTKKRYFAWKFEPRDEGWKEGIDMKGIETVRRDWCELVGDTLRDVIDIILKKDDPMEAVGYFTEIVKKIMKNEVPVNKLVITKTMTKPPESYVGMQPHIELVKKIMNRNVDEVPGIGDRISYVIVKGMGLLSKRAEDPGFVTENGMQVDSKYYIENQLLPPMERIFSVLGVERSTLMGGGRQVNLMCIINGDLGHKPKKEIPISELGGFTCEKCGTFYQRAPLIGSCRCGGKLLFCSREGTAEWVKVGA